MRFGTKSRLLTAALMASVPAVTIAKPPKWEKSASVRWADEAGSVTVAPIAVIPWEEAAPLLQPKFTMTSDQALAQAIPTTQSEDARLSYLFSMALRLSLPTATTATTQTTEGSTDDDAFVTTSKKVQQRGPGSLEGLTDATIPGRTADALGGLTTPASFDRDPMLRHLAATALFQEVALLNRHVSDAVRFGGGQAFLVRLQLSVMPSRRSLPYDVTTDITIHPEDMMARAGLAQRARDEDGGTGTAAPLNTDQVRAKALEALLNPPVSKDPKLEEDSTERRLKALYAPTNRGGSCSGRWNSVSVVPMVVTDNLESIAASRSTDFARQMGLALMATIYNVGAGAKFGETEETIRRAQGRDTNSLLTLARLTDDTVRVRLGAAESPTLGNTMLPRTHNISLVVIYRPCDPEQLDANGKERLLTTVTKASFTDAFTGKTLPYQPAVDRLVEMTVAMNRKYNNRFSYLEYAHLYRLVSRQDRDGFMDFFDKKLAMARFNPDSKKAGACAGLSRDLSDWKKLDLFGKHGTRAAEAKAGKEDEEFLNYLYAGENKPSKDSHDCIRERLAYEVAPNALWTDLQSLRPFSEYSYANIPVVLRKKEAALPPHQTAVVTYSAAGGTATLYQAKDLGSTKGISASLSLKDPSGGNPIVLQSTSAELNANGSLTLRFPPFLDVAKKGDADPMGESLVLSVEALPSVRTFAATRLLPATESYTAKLVSEKPAEPTNDYALSAPASAVVAGADGKARLSVFMKKTAPKSTATALRLLLEGAEVTEVAGATANPEGGWMVTAAGPVTFTLAGLVPGQMVKVTLMGKNEGKDVTLAVALSRPVVPDFFAKAKD